MYDTCVKALDFADAMSWERFFWVDSSTVLSWIRTPPREFRPFVSARVAEIQETIGTEEIRYIKSSSNPADALTRGLDLNHLMKWSEGPSFLELPEAKWPSFQDHTQDTTHADDLAALKEKKTFQKKKKAGKHHTASADVYPEHYQTKFEENPILLHLLKTCSTYSKTRKTLAYVRRFVHNARKLNPKSGPISVQELKAAESHLLKWSQFQVDEESLDKKLMAKKGEDGLFRAHGRLEDVRYLPEELKRPLYPSSDGIWEAPPITLNDLLIGPHNPPPQPEAEERTNPRQLLRSTQNRLADFWRSWMKYFAPNLLPRNKW